MLCWANILMSWKFPTLYQLCSDIWVSVNNSEVNHARQTFERNLMMCVWWMLYSISRRGRYWPSITSYPLTMFVPLPRLPTPSTIHSHKIVRPVNCCLSLSLVPPISLLSGKISKPFFFILCARNFVGSTGLLKDVTDHLQLFCTAFQQISSIYHRHITQQLCSIPTT